jgi:triacylglycerol lipase
MTDRNTQITPADAIKVHSEIRGPIENMSFMQQSLLFAELASLSYYDPGVVEHSLADLEFGESRFFDRDGAQAWVFGNEYDCVVACLGTEPHEWNSTISGLAWKTH